MAKHFSQALAPIIAVVICAIATQAEAAMLKKEPAMGQLRQGQTVLVDDGSCPAGQVKQVTGGDHVKAGGTKQIERSRRCVAR